MIYLLVTLLATVGFAGIVKFACKGELVDIAIGIISVLVLAGSFISLYFIMPVLAYNKPSIYVMVGLIWIMGLIFAAAFDGDDIKITSLFIGLIIYVIIGGVSVIYTWNLFHAHGKQKMLQPTEIVIEATDSIVAATDINNLCTISPEVAEKAILVKMGDLKNTYEVGNLTKQSASCDFEATLADGKKMHIKYNNLIIYVGVLEHRSFWTWRKTKFSPAYVIADASDADKVYVITEDNSEPLKIRYTQGASFNYNFERHMRQNGYLSKILADFDVEIDYNGRPCAPVTTMKNTIGCSTPVVTGVAVVDLQTGEINQYTPENAPEFVNMIQPADVIYDRINWWGDYVYGYFHWSEKSGLTQACEGMDVVQTPNGCFYYVGIRAQTDSVGTQGYMLIDTRTGKATYYKRTGISEAEAIRVLKANTDLNLEMNSGVLKLTEPIFYNIEGLPTYFATYVSTNDYMVKYYGMCSTSDKSVWGYGKTLEEARKNYLNSYYKNESDKVVKFSDKHEIEYVEVKVLEKSNINEVFYFRFEGYEDKVFVGTLSEQMSDMLWSSQKVRISFNDNTNSKFVTLNSYEIII